MENTVGRETLLEWGGFAMECHGLSFALEQIIDTTDQSNALQEYYPATCLARALFSKLDLLSIDMDRGSTDFLHQVVRSKGLAKGIDYMLTDLVDANVPEVAGPLSSISEVLRQDMEALRDDLDAAWLSAKVAA